MIGSVSRDTGITLMPGSGKGWRPPMIDRNVVLIPFIERGCETHCTAYNQPLSLSHEYPDCP